MDKTLYDELRKITPEETRILQGSTTIEKSLYMSGDKNSKMAVIEADKLLEAGKLIQVRKHTRFIHFPIPLVPRSPALHRFRHIVFTLN